VPQTDDSLDVVRRSVDAVNGGDIEAAVDTFHPEIVFEPQRASVQGAYVGHEGIREWFADTRENVAAYRLELQHRDLGGGRVLSLGGLHIQGRGSGIDTTLPVASIAVLRDGKGLPPQGLRRPAQGA